MNNIAVVTVATISYFSQVKCLLKSIIKTNPAWDRYCVIADEVSGEIRSELENLKTGLIEIDDLNLPDANDMKFRYRESEFAMSLKPYAILKLLNDYNRVIFLDSDIYVYRELTEIDRYFESGYDIILSPHIFHQYKETARKPDELDILIAGTINTGMIAANNTYNSRKAMQWWADKLEKGCIEAPERSLVRDQKWLEILPCAFDNVALLRNSAYNAAYWNVDIEEISETDHGIMINGEPLAFFHFSGFEPDKPDVVSKYRHRYTMDEIGCLSGLFTRYAKELEENGYSYWREKNYAFGFFNDGKKIKDSFRILYSENKTVQNSIGPKNPFECSSLFYSIGQPGFRTLVRRFFRRCQ